MRQKDTMSIWTEVDMRYKMFAEQSFGNSDWPSIRRSRAELCLQTWRRIDQEKDIHFDPNEVPELNVSPPKETGLPPGVSPAAIEDSSLREEYLQAIKKNREKAEYYNQQTQIRRMKDKYDKIAADYLVNLYSKPPKAIDEINELLQRFVEDKTEIDVLIERLNK